MKMDQIKALGAGALVLALLVASPALAAFEDWDADSDGNITAEEWGTGFGETGVFDG